MEEMMPVMDIYNEIIQYKKWKDKDRDEKLRTLRKKYRQLLELIVFRDVQYYKEAGSNLIPVKDKLIIKKLLIMSCNGNGRDSTCAAWFNGSLKVTEYEKIAKLYSYLIDYMKELRDGKEIEEITYVRWQAAIDTSLGGETSLKILRLKSLIDKLVENSIVLNNYVNLSDMYYSDDDKWRPVFEELPEEATFISTPVYKIARSAKCQEDYISNLIGILEVLSEEAFDKSCKLILSLLALMKANGVKELKTNVYRENLAFEGVGLYHQIYTFLKKNPEICEQIEVESNTKEVLSFFNILNED